MTPSINANQINTWFRNNGSFNRNPETGNSGFEWPKGSHKYARYASGIWVGARVFNDSLNRYDTLVAIVEYDYEFLPGYTDNNGTPQGKDDPLYRVYKIQKNVNNIDRLQWPNVLLGNSDQGAPVYYDEQTHSWKALDFGSQTMFYAYTDSYPESHGNNAGSTRPLKADVKQINFSIRAGGPLGNIAYSEFIVINRSNKIWENAFIVWWTDDDLGSAVDDAMGCDTNFQLGFVYNFLNEDPEYGPAPPAVGTVLLYGLETYTGNPNDTSIYCEGVKKIIKTGYRQNGIYAINYYADVFNIPRNYRETYRAISGLMPQTGQPIINPVTNQVTRFYFSGDPVTNQGWISTGGGGGETGFLISNGPQNLNPGDTQRIVVAQVIARGTSNLNSITELRQASLLAKKYYSNCFKAAPNPPSPRLSYYAPGNGKIYLFWDDTPERTVIHNTLTTNPYRFQGITFTR
ncbi:MAG: hypothetical protein L0Y77_12475 [Chlorobi bacterium]|nr:hypothetical protein [Chlorobiota bacterium]